MRCTAAEATSRAQLCSSMVVEPLKLPANVAPGTAREQPERMTVRTTVGTIPPRRQRSEAAHTYGRPYLL